MEKLRIFFGKEIKNLKKFQNLKKIQNLKKFQNLKKKFYEFKPSLT